MIKKVIAVLFLVSVITLLWKCNLYSEEEIKMAEEKIKVGVVPVEVGLGDNLSLVLSKNKLNDEYFRKKDTYDSFFLVPLEAHASNPEDPEGYALHYTDGDCKVTFPAGRMLHLGIYAGFINSVSFAMPLEPLNYTEAIALVDDIVARIDKAGFERLRFELPPRTGGLPEGWDRFPVGDWKGCAHSDDYAYDPNDAFAGDAYFVVNIKSYNSTLAAPVTPPMVGKPLPDDAPERYIVVVKSSHMLLLDEAYDLMEKRRIEIHGDKNKEVPLSVWLDDPDWRPQGWQGKYIK